MVRDSLIWMQNAE